MGLSAITHSRSMLNQGSRGNSNYTVNTNPSRPPVLQLLFTRDSHPQSLTTVLAKFPDIKQITFNRYIRLTLQIRSDLSHLHPSQIILCFSLIYIAVSTFF